MQRPTFEALYEALQEIIDFTQTDPCTWREADATVEGYQRLVDKIYEAASDALYPDTKAGPQTPEDKP